MASLVLISDFLIKLNFRFQDPWQNLFLYYLKILIKPKQDKYTHNLSTALFIMFQRKRLKSQKSQKKKKKFFTASVD